MMRAILGLVGALQNYSAAAKLPSLGYANAAEGQRPAESMATNEKLSPR
jgi:hypothetical protein